MGMLTATSLLQIALPAAAVGRFGGQLVDPVVPAVARVPLDPPPRDTRLGGQRQLDQRLPQVAIGDRLSLGVQPVPPLPTLPPTVPEAVHDVRRVTHHLNLGYRLRRHGRNPPKAR